MAPLPEFDPADAAAGRGLIERLTADAGALQRNLLTRNAHTEYLRGFVDGLPPGASAADLREAFKESVPVSGYEDVKPYIDRVAAGEPSSVLCSEPITHLLRSSGTSGGQQKFLPSTAEELDRKVFFYAVGALVRNMHLHADQGKGGKGMYLIRTLCWKPDLVRLARGFGAYCLLPQQAVPGPRYWKPWDGIVRRLWPGARYIQTIVTGSMSQYNAILESYVGGLPLVSPMYGCTECTAGINLKPLDQPSCVSYALLPNIAYFEFVEIKDGDDEKVQETNGVDDNMGEIKVVDLVDVKIGRCYEVIVTTFAGLYRYRVGDLFTVSGFYNATPLFHFSGRRDVVLSIDYEEIREEDLLKAISQAVELHLRPLGYMLGGSTAYADISTLPGHYVLFWELVCASSNHIACDIDQTVMENCCLTLEECFDEKYRKSRHRGSIKALEIRVLKHGACDALMDFFVSRGTSSSQCKTPIAIRSEEAMMVLEERVSGRFFSQETPSCPLYEYQRK